MVKFPDQMEIDEAFSSGSARAKVDFEEIKSNWNRRRQLQQKFENDLKSVFEPKGFDVSYNERGTTFVISGSEDTLARIYFSPKKAEALYAFFEDGEFAELLGFNMFELHEKSFQDQLLAVLEYCGAYSSGLRPENFKDKTE